MAQRDSREIAKVIASALDGDYDDGLEAHMAASATGNGLHVHLFDDEGAPAGTFRIIVEQIS
jgi:hypothetical protein